MKFLITGALNRPGGPRVLVAGALVLFTVYEICMLALSFMSVREPPPETLILALEEVHVAVFLRGMEALFLGSVLIGLPVASLLRKWLPITLFAFPAVAAGLHLMSVSFPSAYLSGIFISCAFSILCFGVQMLIAWKMYAR